MLESGQNWELFGYDMRNLGRHWLDAWRDLLWADDSPVREHLDDAVLLQDVESAQCYQAGKPSAVHGSDYQAILLPEDLVLTKALDLPEAVEVDLASVLALEVNANSPFSTADTCYGWRVIAREGSRLKVLLVILSKSSTMAYLGRQYDVHDPAQYEVWARAGSEMVVVQGFGEVRRERNYRKRLVRVAAMLVVGALILLCIAGAAAGFKAWELQGVQRVAATTERESTDATRMRSALAGANEVIAAVNAVVLAYPNPHTELSRLTHLLEDGESVDNFAMNGLEIELRGRADDAASVMQRLTDEPAYAEVAAPRAITRVRNSDAEQFYLSIRRHEELPQ